MFHKPDDLEIITNVLKAYVEEFDCANVTVNMPKDWKRYASENVNGCKFEFNSVARISIRSNMGATYIYDLNVAG